MGGHAATRGPRAALLMGLGVLARLKLPSGSAGPEPLQRNYIGT
jgi:hypothetical protein